jgi:hypothetical protein
MYGFISIFRMTGFMGAADEALVSWRRFGLADASGVSLLGLLLATPPANRMGLVSLRKCRGGREVAVFDFSVDALGGDNDVSRFPGFSFIDSAVPADAWLWAMSTREGRRCSSRIIVLPVASWFRWEEEENVCCFPAEEGIVVVVNAVDAVAVACRTRSIWTTRSSRSLVKFCCCCCGASPSQDRKTA